MKKVEVEPGGRSEWVAQGSTPAHLSEGVQWWLLAFFFLNPLAFYLAHRLDNLWLGFAGFAATFAIYHLQKFSHSRRKRKLHRR